MKNAFIFFLLGAIAGAVVLRVIERREGPPADRPPATPVAMAPSTPVPATTTADSLTQKLQEWKLTPDDIKQDLAKTGEVVRSKTAAVGERLDDARVVAVVKAKYVLDADLSARAIAVDCHDGEVTLTGSVKSPALIGRAVGLALETHGVHHVVSKLTVSG